MSNPSNGKMETGGWSVQGYPGSHCEPLSHTKVDTYLLPPTQAATDVPPAELSYDFLESHEWDCVVFICLASSLSVKDGRVADAILYINWLFCSIIEQGLFYKCTKETTYLPSLFPLLLSASLTFHPPRSS